MPDRPINLDTDLVSISFTKADLVNVLNFLSMASGVPIIVDADVKGTVTINSMKKVSPYLAYDVINAALRARGYTMVGSLKDKMIRVTTLKKAVVDRPTVQYGNDPTKVGNSDSVITQVIPLSYVSAQKIRDELKPLVGDDQGSLIAENSMNALIATDSEGNIKRLLQIVALLDKDTTDVLEMEVYPCKFANATVLVSSLEKIFGISTSSRQNPNQNMPGGNQPGRPGAPNGAPSAGGAATTTTADGGLISLKGELHIASDDRTNALIISGTRPKIDQVLQVVKRLDVNTTPEVRARVFPLKYADATLVATQLNAIFVQPQGGTSTGGGGYFFRPNQSTTTTDSYATMKRNVVVADVRTNSVVVTATEQNLAQFETLIKELDAPSEFTAIARTYQLRFAQAQTVATTLNNLFRGNSSRTTGNSFRDLILGTSSTTAGDPISNLRNITVVADVKSNTLLITGPPQVFSMIDQLIGQIDKRAVQVFIEVVIVDVTLDDTTKFGVEWEWKNGSHPTSTNRSVGQELNTAMDLATEKFGMKYSVISNNMQALLHALTLKSNVRVYSTPSITTADNVAALITIGQDQPYLASEETTTAGTTRQTVDFKNVSISLNVTPHVTQASNIIGLDVNQTINELLGIDQTLNAPIVANRQAKTTVSVSDGQTIVIGGIIKSNKTQTRKQVPLLSQIPLLGEAFKTRSTQETKSELMVFITPHILRDEQSIDQITDAERNKLSDPGPFKAPDKK